MFYFFFFFQAEDGIRDRNVTGVQTCALPILDDKMLLCQLSHAQSFLKNSLSSLIDAYDTVLYENGTHTIKA